VGNHRVDYEDDRLRIITADNVQIAGWFDAPELAHLRTLDRCFKRLKREIEGAIVFVNVVVSGVPKFSAEVREEAARQAADFDERDLATCHIILVDGFTGTAVRAFMSTATLLGRPTHPTKVFGDLPGAARWITTQLGREPRFTWEETRVIRLLRAAAEPLPARAAG
jgi:hypothetical protein